MARKRRHKRRRKVFSGTEPSKQWLYFMINFPFFFVIKVGISRDKRTLWKRWTDIGDENMGIDIPIFFIKCYMARKIETMNKRLGSKIWMKANFFSGTGKTERFIFPGAIPALIVSILVFLVEWSFYLGIVIAFIYTMKNFPT